jgi:hypothetical protein
MDLLSWSGPELGMNNALMVRINPTNMEWHEISTGKHIRSNSCECWMSFQSHPVALVLNAKFLRGLTHFTSFECWMPLQTTDPLHKSWMLNVFGDTHPLQKFWMLNAFADTHSTSFYCWQEVSPTSIFILLESHMKSNISTYERVGEAWVAILFACTAAAAARVSHEIQCLHSWESWWGPSSNNLLICQW